MAIEAAAVTLCGGVMGVEKWGRPRPERAPNTPAQG